MKLDSRSIFQVPSSLSSQMLTKPLMSVSQPTYQPTNPLTYQPTHLPTNQPTYQPTNPLTNQPTHLPTNQPTYQPTNPLTNQPTHLPTNQPTYQPTNPLTNQPTHLPTNQPTYQPTNPLTNSSQSVIQPTQLPPRKSESASTYTPDNYDIPPPPLTVTFIMANLDHKLPL
ncbi:hypothetical protein Pmani_035818 [Petrolisthes manimaculis]|uniref:Uncharacterized protein n=1 Tax=Petrolisthes manimaculis TaxID=1843537 RepID=A0AAE1TQ24_9EUCA|nr:hypothetical protein Pmani_035818 [Petrolisthes manimaculis]